MSGVDTYDVSIAKTTCPICAKALQENPQSLLILFLCRHVVHGSCVLDGSGGGGGDLVRSLEPFLHDVGFGGGRKGISASVAL